MIKIVLFGACGKMGLECVRTVASSENIQLIGAVDPRNIGEDIGILAGIGKLGLTVEAEPSTIDSADAILDFTDGTSALQNIKFAVSHGVSAIVGSTGIPEQELRDCCKNISEKDIAVLIVPNFSIGATLMMKFAEEAAKYFEGIEIIELHHENKKDAPSGTSILTADRIAAEKESCCCSCSQEKIAGARGADRNSVRIHSVRLPGLVAHQEVIMGSTGELLTIRHDSTSRTSFMQGVVTAINKIKNLKGLLFGLENVL